MVAKKTISNKKETLEQKSPAEFFADNKNIAGFDNVSWLAWPILVAALLCVVYTV